MNDIKSKQRVADHGEVFTPAWMVEAMLDLVKDETEWGYLGKGRFQRRDFRFDSLTLSSTFSAESSLFALLGKHEIFKPVKTYPPMTVSDLADAKLMVSDRPTSRGQAAPTAIDTQAKGVSL
jgi:hypothetical protein